MATDVVVLERARKYHWPEAQLNWWIFIMLVSSSLNLGVFSYFMSVQQTMNLPVPWIFPYMVCISGLALLFLILIYILIGQKQLLPGIVVVGSFMLFVLWLTGMIETAVQLFGPSGGVNGRCQQYVTGQTYTGVSVGTLAWLAQQNICNCWSASFAFQVVETVFLFWMLIIAYKVNGDEYN